MSSNITLTLLEKNIDRGYADKIAIRTTAGRSISYAELAAEVAKAANFLKRHGVRSEERVLILLDDSPDFVIFFLAALRIGAVAVPVSTFADARLYATYLSETRAPVLVTQQRFKERVDEALGLQQECGTNVIYVEHQEWSGEDDACPAFPVHEDDSAFWLFTSGSTGRPKAVIHRHYGPVVISENYARNTLGMTDSDRCLSTSKMFFAYGLGNSLFFPLSVGATTILHDAKCDADSIRRILESAAPTIFSSIPSLYKAYLGKEELTKADFDSIRLFVSAGEPLSETVLNKWESRFGHTLLDGVGSTEALHIYCSNTPGCIGKGTSGKPVSGYRLKIADEFGNEVPDGEPGVLYVSGQSIAKGYWNRYDESRKIFKGEWLSTGDIYRVTSDGFYKYLGRRGDTFKSSGLWVSSSEIEDALTSLDGVSEAVALGCVSECGEQYIKAFVMLGPEVTQTQPEIEATIRTNLSSRLSSYKIPRFIEVVPSFPRTATGKIARSALYEI